jgi:hypothetical protein
VWSKTGSGKVEATSPRFSRKIKKWHLILSFAVLEVIVIVGAVPGIEPRTLSFFFGSEPSWEEKRAMFEEWATRNPPTALWDNPGLLEFFLIAVGVLTVYITRNRPTEAQVYSTCLAIGALLATSLGVRSLDL